MASDSTFLRRRFAKPVLRAAIWLWDNYRSHTDEAILHDATRPALTLIFMGVLISSIIVIGSIPATRQLTGFTRPIPVSALLALGTVASLLLHKATGWRLLLLNLVDSTLYAHALLAFSFFASHPADSVIAFTFWMGAIFWAQTSGYSVIFFVLNLFWPLLLTALLDPHGLIRLAILATACVIYVYLGFVNDRRRAHLHEVKKLSNSRTEDIEEVRLLGRAGAELAHEMKQPLAAIRGFSQRLRRHTETLGGDAEDVEAIVTATERLAQMVNRVRLLAHNGRPELVPINPVEPVQDAVLILRDRIERIGVDLRWEPPQSATPPVLGDRERLGQVMLNLISNGCDALSLLPDGRPRQLAVEVAANDEWVIIRVEDNGPGISKEVEGRIFEPYFTTKDKTKTMGLGLAISREIVAEHDGTLRFEPITDGARFVVSLPIANVPEQS